MITKIVMDTTYYFPWVRKGLSNCITEKDTLGDGQNQEPLSLQRPKLFVSSRYNVTAPATSDKDSTPATSVRVETKEVEFISPGEITNVNAAAIICVAPKEKSAAFPVDYLPYIEFYEPDFPWRYTPAQPREDKLRPWLALLVCKSDEFVLEKSSGGSGAYVSLQLNNEEAYQNIFLSPENTWKTAHAQGKNKSTPIFSRLLAMRRKTMEENTEYFAFLIPLFETGRLRGLGFEEEALSTITAQASAWEATLATQKQKHPQRPLDFPVYYHWSFKTGTKSFDTLVEELTIEDISKMSLPADIQVDVTDMGEGLSYSQLPQSSETRREVLGVPVAAMPINYAIGSAFPAKQGGEAELYRRMKDLISKNPVFAENLAEISGGVLEGEQVGDDDPWVAPPIYGGKHAMTTSIEENDNRETPWIPELNMDVHHRVAAGMGRKIVQENQEEFVNRAWKQVEAVNALNQELRQRLLSGNTGESLTHKMMQGIDDKHGSAYVALLMKYLDSLKYAATDSGNSLAKILNDNKIPLSFATAAFHNLTAGIEDIDETSLMERIASEQIFRMKEHRIERMIRTEQLREVSNWKFDVLRLVFTEKVLADIKKRIKDNSKIIVDDTRSFRFAFPEEKEIVFMEEEMKDDFFSDIYLSDYAEREAISRNYFNKYHLQEWHDYFKNKATNLSENLIAWSIFKEIENYLKTNKSSVTGGFVKGKTVEESNVLIITNHDFETLFGKDVPSCVRLGGEEGYYIMSIEKLNHFLRADYSPVQGYVKLPYITMPLVEGKHSDYGQKIGHFRMRYDNEVWHFDIASKEDDALITIDYEGAKELNNLFITIKSDTSTVNSALGRTTNLDKDFFGFSVPVETGGDGIKRYKMKYRLSSYYHPAFWPFRNPQRAEVELDENDIKTMNLTGELRPVPQAPEEIKKEILFPALQGFHYPQGFFGTFQGNNEPRWGRLMEFIEATAEYNYYSHYKETAFQVFKDTYAHGNDYNNTENMAYRKIKDNIAFIMDPKGYRKLFYYADIQYYNMELSIGLLEKNDAWVTNNIPFNNKTMPAELSHPYQYDKNAMGKATFELSNISSLNANVNKCAELKQQALEYLFTNPDYVELDVERLKQNNDYKEIDTLYDFACHHDPTLQDDVNVYINQYNTILKMLNEFEAFVNKIEVPPAQTESPVTKPNEKEIKDIQDAFMKNEGYERMVAVAQDYYSAFFANTTEGKKLRDKYVDELLHSKYPIMAYPMFPEPTYYYLREMSEKFILPCVEQLPEDSIALFRSNAAFEEAYLCGMNTEMGKELLWREYPTDQRGSYFRKFWDSETSVEDIHNDNFFDVNPLHHWKNPLGGNHNASKSGLLVFAVKGKLIRQYPNTLIYLHKAVLTGTDTLDFSKEETSDTIVLPELTAWVSEDVFLVGFKKELSDLKGNLYTNPRVPHYGYFLAFKEDMLDINFAMLDKADDRTAGKIAAALLNVPSVYGKHGSLFL